MKFVIVAAILLLSFAGNSDAVCKNLLSKGVSSGERSTIVNQHNSIRLSVAQGRRNPKASNMKRMSWDDKLAQAAQKISDTCVYGHAEVDDSRFSVGQNIYYNANTASNKTADWTSAIKAWVDEYSTYNFGTSEYNHYTQIVWADTYLVGCGYTYYQNRPGWYEKYYVCNYGPAGNYIGQTPYKVGSGCENLC